MTLRQDIIDQIADLQAKLDILNSVAEDTFNFGTVVVFSAATGAKWYYVKVAEETWRNMSSTTPMENSLAAWILEAKESSIGYFEVYPLIVQSTPFYASA